MKDYTNHNHPEEMIQIESLTTKNSTFKKRIFDFYNLSESLYESVRLTSDNILVRHIPSGKLINFRY